MSGRSFTQRCIRLFRAAPLCSAGRICISKRRVPLQGRYRQICSSLWDAPMCSSDTVNGGMFSVKTMHSSTRRCFLPSNQACNRYSALVSCLKSGKRGVRKRPFTSRWLRVWKVSIVRLWEKLPSPMSLCGPSEQVGRRRRSDLLWAG